MLGTTWRDTNLANPYNENIAITMDPINLAMACSFTCNLANKTKIMHGSIFRATAKSNIG